MKKLIIIFIFILILTSCNEQEEISIVWGNTLEEPNKKRYELTVFGDAESTPIAAVLISNSNKTNYIIPFSYSTKTGSDCFVNGQVITQDIKFTIFYNEESIIKNVKLSKNEVNSIFGQYSDPSYEEIENLKIKLEKAEP